MKFSKVLAQVSSELPELNDMFLRYKQLKKQLKTIPKPEDVPQGKQTAGEGTSSSEPRPAVNLSAEELNFINTLNQDLAKFNRFFIEREEEAVIQLQALQERLLASKTPEAAAAVRARLVDFHGSCILMLHWSLLNYAAVAKILKKHDKRTGVLLRAPYLANVLQQPFNSTNIMSRLVKRAEDLLNASMDTSLQEQLQQLDANQAAAEKAADATSAGPSNPNPDLGTDTHQQPTAGSDGEAETTSSLTEISDSVLLRRTQLALQTWDTLSRTAVTPSTILIDTSGAHTSTVTAGRSGSMPPPHALPPPKSATAPVLLVCSSSALSQAPGPSASGQQLPAPAHTLAIPISAAAFTAQGIALPTGQNNSPPSPVRWDPFKPISDLSDLQPFKRDSKRSYESMGASSDDDEDKASDEAAASAPAGTAKEAQAPTRKQARHVRQGSAESVADAPLADTVTQGQPSGPEPTP